MTDLEIFERVRDHLLTQGAKSETVNLDADGTPIQCADGTPDTTCLYRGPNGRMCAVGCLIPDAVYDESIEGTVVPDVEEGEWYRGLSGSYEEIANALTRSGIPARESTAALLKQLQDLHDYAEPSEWPGLLSDMATCFDGDLYKA